jgi:hypothetical protein
MENPIFDNEFFEFFVNLLKDDEEIELLHQILEGKDKESIIKEYIQKLKESSNDQNQLHD